VASDNVALQKEDGFIVSRRQGDCRQDKRKICQRLPFARFFECIPETVGTESIDQCHFNGNVTIDSLAKFLYSCVDIFLLPVALTATLCNLFGSHEGNSFVHRPGAEWP
jgi:hypothetical protein